MKSYELIVCCFCSILKLWVLLNVIFLNFATSSQEHVTIVTPLGKIVGRNEGSVISYLGIPYAEPPIGKNRYYIIIAAYSLQTK